MFVIVQFQVKDFQKYFEHYGSQMSSVAAKFGGEFLAASREAIAKEGASSGNFTAILRFPSEEAAIAMYNSQEYAPLKAKRLELTNGGNVIFVPGIEKSHHDGSTSD
ncbi:DUF1330 domain-containing protein [Dokdonella fugitiva]|jgi:uncharacterized protein (DUF1330 family)|uniref:DUF1330 domain-containing protein n=1 Tax=Dokdonella fugitiva TaxID=328517 RepID=UPI002410D327|nr:DUF1330 domain-containing protein [Dokdonella fugitiva]